MEYLYLVAAVFIVCLPAVGKLKDALTLGGTHIIAVAVFTGIVRNPPRKMADLLLMGVLSLVMIGLWLATLWDLGYIIYCDFRHEHEN